MSLEGDTTCNSASTNIEKQCVVENVLFITMGTTSRDHLGKKGGKIERELGLGKFKFCKDISWSYNLEGILGFLCAVAPLLA